MIFGLFKKNQVSPAEATAPKTQFSRNVQSLSRFRNLKKDNVIVNEDQIRFGALSTIARMSKDDFQEAFINMENLRLIKNGEKKEFVQRLIDLLESNEFKTAMSAKFCREKTMALNGLREICRDYDCDCGPQVDVTSVCKQDTKIGQRLAHPTKNTKVTATAA